MVSLEGIHKWNPEMAPKDGTRRKAPGNSTHKWHPLMHLQMALINDTNKWHPYVASLEGTHKWHPQIKSQLFKGRQR